MTTWQQLEEVVCGRSSSVSDANSPQEHMIHISRSLLCMLDLLYLQKCGQCQDEFIGMNSVLKQQQCAESCGQEATQVL